MEKQTKTVQALAEELGFDSETMHALMIEFAVKTIHWNLNTEVHPLEPLILDARPGDM
jgi:hypothetical protein